jgi:hypothetical protein
MRSLLVHLSTASVDGLVTEMLCHHASFSWNILKLSGIVLTPVVSTVYARVLTSLGCDIYEMLQQLQRRRSGLVTTLLKKRQSNANALRRTRYILITPIIFAFCFRCVVYVKYLPDPISFTHIAFLCVPHRLASSTTNSAPLSLLC